MQENLKRPGLSVRGHLAIAAVLWTVVGAGLLTMGAVFWFHLPYLGFLDRYHFLVGGMALGVGLLKGQFVLNRTANRVIDRVQDLAEPNPLKSVFQMFGWKTILLILSMMGIGVALRWAGVSFEVRGLIYLAVGLALLWSSRCYWRGMLQGFS